MDIDDQRIEEVVRNTEILRLPRRKLATFGTTNVYYYIVTEPAYSDPAENVTETVVREGRVIAEKPRIVTPYYLSRLEGFSQDARHYFDMLIKAYGANAPACFIPTRTSLCSLILSPITCPRWLAR